ncbi:hypothetical protein IEQ34_021625 [Dendrobium chrysotoxum]|uniref:MADS-box domain-containing protein n=1 Tax=Dendrobium chrysotoxum TaxID=161865 RepID=A0AAV7G6D8_DENCH|nr:hypothetical protein IEQ34_021625 [Dendrobium chrysotoxum]
MQARIANSNKCNRKASELSILCYAEICVVFFSPTGKAFSFGHPPVDVVAHRFLADKEKMRRAALNEALTAPQLGANKPFRRNGEVELMRFKAVKKPDTLCHFSEHGEELLRVQKSPARAYGYRVHSGSILGYGVNPNPA